MVTRHRLSPSDHLKEMTKKIPLVRAIGKKRSRFFLSIHPFLVPKGSIIRGRLYNNCAYKEAYPALRTYVSTCPSILPPYWWEYKLYVCVCVCVSSFGSPGLFIHLRNATINGVSNEEVDWHSNYGSSHLGFWQPKHTIATRLQIKTGWARLLAIRNNLSGKPLNPPIPVFVLLHVLNQTTTHSFIVVTKTVDKIQNDFCYCTLHIVANTNVKLYAWYT